MNEMADSTAQKDAARVLCMVAMQRTSESGRQMSEAQAKLVVDAFCSSRRRQGKITVKAIKAWARKQLTVQELSDISTGPGRVQTMKNCFILDPLEAEIKQRESANSATQGSSKPRAKKPRLGRAYNGRHAGDLLAVIKFKCHFLVAPFALAACMIQVP